MESENKILKPLKCVAICTKVEDVNTLFALYELTPEIYRMQPFSAAHVLCEGGGVYLALFDGCLYFDSSFIGAWHAPSVRRMSVLVDNFIFAMFLRYAFKFTPETSGHE